MITKLFNAKILYKRNTRSAQIKIDSLFNKHNIYPHTAELIIHNNFAPNLYIKNKIKFFYNINIQYSIFKFSTSIKLKSIIKILQIIGQDQKINSILFQLPIPKRLKQRTLFKNIKKKKDIDMLNPKNFTEYIIGYKKNEACTSAAVIKILNIIAIKIKQLKIILLGFSNIIGRPLLFNLFNKHATILIINKKYRNLKFILRHADIIIIAIGKINFLKPYNVPYGCIVIDIGININKNHITTGDFKITKNINERLSYLTPVPGGIGLVTINNLANKTIEIITKKMEQ